ncbi:MAG: hypothetical protein ACOYMG_02430 [Candidatus Methylumidiphilus sp.]
MSAVLTKKQSNKYERITTATSGEGFASDLAWSKKEADLYRFMSEENRSARKIDALKRKKRRESPPENVRLAREAERERLKTEATTYVRAHPVMDNEVREFLRENTRRLQAIAFQESEERKARYAGQEYGMLDQNVADVLAIRSAIHDRLENGFCWTGGNIGDNTRYYRAPEQFAPELLSMRPGHAGDLLSLIVQRLGKNTVGGETPSSMKEYPRFKKLLVLDLPYLKMNMEMRGLISIRLQKTFSSWQVFADAVDATGIKWPNTASAHKDEDGRIVDPCLVWVLKNPVCFTGNGSSKPQGAYQAIVRGLYLALRDMGAVIESLEDGIMKSPICHLWDTLVTDIEPYDLLEIGKGLSRNIPDSMLFGMKGVNGDDISRAVAKYFKGGENPFWAAVMKFAQVTVRQYWTVGRENKDKFSDKMFAFATAVASSCKVSRSEVYQVTTKIVNWIFANHDPSKINKNKYVSGQGPCAELTKGVSTSEAQAIGGRYTVNHRRCAALSKVRSAVEELVRKGIAVTAKAVAEITGQCLRTAKTWLSIFRRNDKNDTQNFLPERVQNAPTVRKQVTRFKFSFPKVPAIQTLKSEVDSVVTGKLKGMFDNLSVARSTIGEMVCEV